MPNLSLVFDVLAIDRASEVFRRVGDAAGESGKKVEAASTGVANAGSKIAAGVGIAAAAAAVASVKMAGDFQAATTRLVTSANETTGNLDSVRKGLLDLMGSVGYSSDEVTRAMYKVESGGQHGADGLTVLRAAAQGAKTENADLTTVADALTSVMQDYHLKASDAADVTSKLVASTASGKMTFQELAASLHSVLPVASVAHISLNDILGDLASMTVHGMSADQATQNMADAIRHLQSASQMSGKELALLGFTGQQISRDLGTKGLSGVVQELSEAVAKRLGPGASDVILQLGTALNGLNPKVRDLGQKLMDGSISQGDYVKAAKELAPELQGQALQFDTLAKATHSIGNEQMSGSEVMQSYAGVMKGLMGDATGMNVALMLTGENTKTTTTAIENVTKATADAKGNVQGWDLIQGNFNQKLSQAKGHIEAMAIEFGTKLLPALTSSMDFVNSTVLPGIEHLGSDAAAAAKWFSQLPQPIKDMALALAALRVADMVGIFDKLSTASGRFREEMALQAALYKAQNSGLSDVERALGGVASSSGAAESGLSKFGTVAANVANQGMAALKSAGTGLMSMFGGPWGLAIAGATLAIGALNSVVQHHDDQVKKATDDVAKWYKTLALGSPGDVASAQRNLDDLRAKIKSMQDSIDAYNKAAASGNARGGIGTLISQQKDLRDELARGQKQWEDYRRSLTPTQLAAEDVAAAQAQLEEALKHGTGSHEAQVAAAHYNDELARQKSLAEQVTAAEQTQIDKVNQLANVQLTAVSSTLGDAQAQSQLASAVAQYAKDAADGQHSTKDLADESNNLAQQAIGAAKAAAQHAVDQAKANGVTDDGTLANKTLLDALKKSADQITGPGHDALVTAITDLEKTTLGAGTLADTVTKMGATLATTWGNNTVVLKSATDQQIQDMKNLGYAVTTLPNGNVVVNADTGPARAQMQSLVDSYKNYSININPQGMALTTEQRNALYSGKAAGGPIVGPGTGTSDTAGLFALSNGEHVWTAAETQAAGGHAGVEALRKAVLAAGRGRAAGGPAEVTESARFSDAYMASAMALIAKMGAMGQANVAAAGAGGAARWSGLVLQALGIEGQPSSLLGSVLRRMNQESGGNPYAINLWDSNAAAGTPSKGLMQVIDPTFRAYHHPGTSWDIYDPLANVLSSMDYALSRYGSLSAAYDRVGGYKNGTNYVPTDQLAFLHKGEAVIPASRNQGAPYADSGHPAVFHLYDSDGALMGTMRGVAEAATSGALRTVHNAITYGG